MKGESDKDGVVYGYNQTGMRLVIDFEFTDSFDCDSKFNGLLNSVLIGSEQEQGGSAPVEWWADDEEMDSERVWHLTASPGGCVGQSHDPDSEVRTY